MGNYKQVKVNLDIETYDMLEKEAISMNMNLAQFFRLKAGVELSTKSRFRKNRTDNSEKINHEILLFLSKISKELNYIAEKLSYGNVDTRLILFSLLEIRDELKRFEIIK